MTLSDLPVGSLIKDTGTTYNGETIVWRILEHGHSGDPSGTTALEARDIISLKCFDAIEPSNSDSDRKSYGNNRYLYSNLLQWLNSDAAAGSWYSAKHSADAGPTNANVWSNYNEYNQEAGFLSNFSANLKNALETVSKTTAKNTVTDGGGSETVQSKIFLLSTTEIGLSNENSIAEGSIYKYYSDSNNNARRVKKPTEKCVSKSEYTSSNLNTSSGWYWWLRTPISGNSCGVRFVDTDGSLNNFGAYNGDGGVSPAYVISSDTLVSDSPDSDGAYTIQWNASPSIEPATKALGSVTAAPSQSITITDTDGDSFTGVVKLDGTQKATFSGTASLEYALPIDDIWSDMSLAAHTITVEVTDSAGNTSAGTYTLTKTNSAPVLSPATKSFGFVATAPTLSVTVTDADGNDYTGIVKLDGTQKTTFSGASTGTHTVPISEWWSTLSNANHTITVTVTDSAGGSTTNTYTFTKFDNDYNVLSLQNLEFILNKIKSLENRIDSL